MPCFTGDERRMTAQEVQAKQLLETEWGKRQVKAVVLEEMYSVVSEAMENAGMDHPLVMDTLARLNATLLLRVGKGMVEKQDRPRDIPKEPYLGPGEGWKPTKEPDTIPVAPVRELVGKAGYWAEQLHELVHVHGIREELMEAFDNLITFVGDVEKALEGKAIPVDDVRQGLRLADPCADCDVRTAAGRVVQAHSDVSFVAPEDKDHVRRHEDERDAAIADLEKALEEAK